MCRADKCRKLIWKFNLENHLKEKHANLSQEEAVKLLGDTKQYVEHFKKNAEATLIEKQTQKTRKRKRVHQKDPTFEPGMSLTVPFPININLQRSYYLQGRMV